MRFADHMDQTAVFDIFGATASESVASLYRLLDDPELSQKWEEIQHDEQ